MLEDTLFTFVELHKKKKGIVDKFSEINTLVETVYTRFSYLREQIEKATQFDYERKRQVVTYINSSRYLLQKILGTTPNLPAENSFSFTKLIK